MPKSIKTIGSIGILSTMLTFVILGVLGWSGVGTLYAYNNKSDLTHITKHIDNIDKKLTKILEVVSDEKVIIEANSVRLDYHDEVLRSRK